MDVAALSAKHIQEAINYETVLLSAKKSESHMEPIFEQIGEIVPLGDPLTLHPNTYAEYLGISAQELLETHSHVKARFLRLDDSDIVLKRGDGVYPQPVARISGSPRFLYVRGNHELLDTKCVCVIGTRNPSNEGKTYAKETVQHLAGHMVTIVSGLALGIDGIAHITSLATGTATIAVLGTPLTEVYPSEHRKLQKMIGEKGLLVTRFSPATQTQKWHFLLRNQLMSSLSIGSIVVEDRDGGGAVKQAQYALDQQRKVVVFQHVLDNRSLLWPRRLALRSGVLVVKHPNSIHARLFSPATQAKPQEIAEARPAQLSLFDLS